MRSIASASRHSPPSTSSKDERKQELDELERAARERWRDDLIAKFGRRVGLSNVGKRIH